MTRRISWWVCVLLISPGFSQAGDRNDERTSTSADTVKIGLLVPDRGVMSQEATDAVRLAVDQHNQKKQSTRIFRLVTASCEGPWGVASKASVRLLHEMGAVAMITSLDGRNAHLAEQVAVKSRKVMLATRSTDMSLSYAYVPWFFRCVPDDARQAGAIHGAIDSLVSSADVALIASDSYDGRVAVESFKKVGGQGKGVRLRTFLIDATSAERDGIAREVAQATTGALVFFDAYALRQLSKELGDRAREVPAFLHQRVVFDEWPRQETLDCFNRVFVVSPAMAPGAGNNLFRKQFRALHQYEGSLAAAYAYEGAGLLMDAIDQVGVDTEALQQYLRFHHFDVGIFGRIGFDRYGNCDAPLRIMGIGAAVAAQPRR